MQGPRSGAGTFPLGNTDLPQRTSIPYYPLDLEPRHDESLVGFVFRMAGRRGMDSGYQLMARLGLSWTTTPRHHPLQRVVDGLGVSRETLMRMATWQEYLGTGGICSSRESFLGKASTFPLYDSTDLRYRHVCPRCLETDSYYRASWSLAFVTVCPTHSVELLTRCPGCGSRLAWAGTDAALCGACGCSMGHKAGKPISPTLASATSVALGLVGDPRYAEDAAAVCQLPPMRGVEPGTALGLLVSLGREFQHLRRQIPVVEAVASGLRMCSDWPRNFRLVPRPDSPLHHDQELARWSTWLRRLGHYAKKMAPSEGSDTVRAEIANLRAGSKERESRLWQDHCNRSMNQVVQVTTSK